MSAFAGTPYAGSLISMLDDSERQSLHKLVALIGQLVPGASGASVGYTSSNLSNPTATTASSAILAANPARKYAIITNMGTVDAWLSIGVAAQASMGIYLKAGAAYEVNGTNFTAAAINATTASGTANFSILEGI